MLNIRSIRWAETDEGMACGPMGSQVGAEVIYVDENDKVYFVCVTRFNEFFNAVVSKTPVFESYMNLVGNPDKLKEGAMEYIDCEEEDLAGLVAESAYAKAIQFVQYCLNYAMDHDCTTDAEAAMRFSSEYLYMNVEDVEFELEA